MGSTWDGAWHSVIFITLLSKEEKESVHYKGLLRKEKS